MENFDTPISESAEFIDYLSEKLKRVYKVWKISETGLSPVRGSNSVEIKLSTNSRKIFIFGVILLRSA